MVRVAVEEWQLLFRQTHQASGGGFFENTGNPDANTQNPDAPLFSLLSEMEQFRRLDGTFHFRMSWPGMCELVAGYCIDGIDYIVSRQSWWPGS